MRVTKLWKSCLKTEANITMISSAILGFIKTIVFIFHQGCCQKISINPSIKPDLCTFTEEIVFSKLSWMSYTIFLASHNFIYAKKRLDVKWWAYTTLWNILVFHQFLNLLILRKTILIKKRVYKKHFGCNIKPVRQCTNCKNDDRACNYCLNDK